MDDYDKYLLDKVVTKLVSHASKQGFADFLIRNDISVEEFDDFQNMVCAKINRKDNFI